MNVRLNSGYATGYWMIVSSPAKCSSTFQCRDSSVRRHCEISTLECRATLLGHDLDRMRHRHKRALDRGGKRRARGFGRFDDRLAVKLAVTVAHREKLLDF